MSEYQYYEFQALDRPLDADARAALREITSRGEITATSLINEYHFGDFRGDPQKLVEQYFDAFLYLANWGTRTVMLRLPRAALSLAEVEPYVLEDNEFEDFFAWQTKDHVIVSFEMRDENRDIDFDVDPSECLDPILPIRNELLSGDRRPLYLGWLLAAQQAYFDDDEENVFEPPVPPGLKSLSAAQKALAEFLYIDPDLIAAAADRSAKLSKTDPAEEKEQAAWVAALPAGEKDAYLLQLLRGEGTHLSMELQRRFRDEQASKRPKANAAAGEAPRSLAELRARAEVIAEEEQERERLRKQREREKQERQQAEARETHLASLAGKEEELWQRVEPLVALKLPAKYKEAVNLLTDLHGLARRAGAEPAFATRMQALRQKHAAKRTFIERLDKANLP